MTQIEIQNLALEHGFKLKLQPDGSMELNPYVFNFARALLETQLVPTTPIPSYPEHSWSDSEFELTFDERTEGAWKALCSGGTKAMAAKDFELPFFYIRIMTTLRDNLRKKQVHVERFTWKDIEQMVNIAVMVSKLVVS